MPFGCIRRVEQDAAAQAKKKSASCQDHCGPVEAGGHVLSPRCQALRGGYHDGLRTTGAIALGFLYYIQWNPPNILLAHACTRRYWLSSDRRLTALLRSFTWF